MNKKLRIAKVNKVEYCSLSISGIEMQHALAYIFELFGVKVDKQNIFVDDYQVTREQLQNLHECITSQGSEFQKHSSLFDEYLKIANIDKDKFLQILDDLIYRSDQQNPQILISWSNNKNKPIDINDIKSIQFISEVVLSETLASIPADGLSLEEAFKLYVEAMYWGEGDRFYMAKEDEGDIKISSSDRAFVETEAAN
ncbi:hypothetical protein [Bacteroides cellulosilyticus]|uniref:hypothetical protein n=1 Tax=Bacteroides cellulosilyticus TaxID=246787 RepID=UPI0022E299E4|nr:hypothetical protein [Bacteroides cellulosilyticus]